MQCELTWLMGITTIFQRSLTVPCSALLADKLYKETVSQSIFPTRAAHAAKSEDMRGETDFLELRRQYHCAAYNALIAVISCTQSDVKFYNAFLFTDTPAKVGMKFRHGAEYFL